MLTLEQWTTEDHPCEYLPDRLARLEYVLVEGLTPAEYEDRMNLGWRKFGHLLFHPVCAACDECRPIRIPVDSFTPDRSQRRAIQRNEADMEIRFAAPQFDQQRLDLYNRYHASQEQRKGWHFSKKTPDEYAFSFVFTPTPAVEITVWQGPNLRAVVLNDVTPNVVSGIYHFHDPDLRDRSIGVFAMLQTIDLARRLGRRYAYFGFYVADSPSLAYKSRFRPCEILGMDGVWREFEG